MAFGGWIWSKPCSRQSAACGETGDGRREGSAGETWAASTKHGGSPDFLNKMTASAQRTIFSTLLNIEINFPVTEGPKNYVRGKYWTGRTGRNVATQKLSPTLIGVLTPFK